MAMKGKSYRTGVALGKLCEPPPVKIKRVVLKYDDLQRVAALELANFLKHAAHAAPPAYPAFTGIQFIIGMIKTVAALVRAAP